MSRSYAALRNPPWSAARWRADEHPDEVTFAQWYYAMLTDAQTNDTYSLGIGGFRGANESGGWLRRRRHLGVGAPEPRPPPTLSVPFTSLTAASAPSFDVTINGADGAPALIRLQALSPMTLALTMALPPPAEIAALLPVGAASSSIGWAWAELEFERVYGVFGGTGRAEAGPPTEACGLANLPFAYDSLARGRICVAGGCGRLAAGALGGGDGEAELLTSASSAIVVDASPRWRAYVESTVTCGQFPRPGAVHGGVDGSEYPWKWMWAVVPPTAAASEPARTDDTSPPLQMPPRDGSIVGEVGLVMSYARLAVPLPAPPAAFAAALQSFGSVAATDAATVEPWLIDLDVDAIFIFADMPETIETAGGGGEHPARLGASNVSVALASRGGGALVDWTLERLLSPGGLGVLRAASPEAGALASATVEHSDWALFEDVHGRAALPTRQTARLTTAKYALAATFATLPAHYARLAFAYDAAESDGSAPRRRVVSDLRAAAASAYLRIAALSGGGGGSGSDGSSGSNGWDDLPSAPLPGDAPHVRLPPGFGRLLFQGYAPHNALEFAYHAPYDGALQHD